MPFPTYSFVVIETTVDGVTTTESHSYKTTEAAGSVYKDAIDDGKRAFLYEQLAHSKFNRNDDQPISTDI